MGDFIKFGKDFDIIPGLGLSKKAFNDIFHKVSDVHKPINYMQFRRGLEMVAEEINQIKIKE